MGAVRTLVVTGSSPLTRGKPLPVLLNMAGLRLIPAHAGKTSTASRSPTRTRAHPRSRGENACALSTRLMASGSSPLTRGKLTRLHPRRLPAGLIPAHAGKTYRAARYAMQGRAHPRSRGENYRGVRVRPGVEGSSPLTRGKPYRIGRGPSVTRLIPAHAGKTADRSSLSLPRSAHPRSRGENAKIPWRPACPPGSSPLTRGKR